MDFTKDIYLNTDKLYENSSLIILYNGFLSKEPENKVYLNYGYNDNWERKDELKLKRTEKGMLGVIRVSSGNTFQFVFRNDYNQWDNNNNANYIIPIYEKEETILDFGPKDLKQVVTDVSQEVTTENVSDTHDEELTKDTDLVETSIYSSSEIHAETFNSNQSSQRTSEATINELETKSEETTTETSKETASTTTENETISSQESNTTSTSVNTATIENALDTTLSAKTPSPEDTYQATTNTDADTTASTLESTSSLETENNTKEINENEVKEATTYATNAINTETTETDSTKVNSELSKTQQAIKEVFEPYASSVSTSANIKNTITRPTTFSTQSVEKANKNTTNSATNSLESKIYTTSDVTFENTYKIDSSSLPKNTLVNKIVLDNTTNTYFVKKKLIATPVAEQLKLTQEFSNFAETLETNPAPENKTQTSAKPKEISPSTPRVEMANQAVKDFNETQDESTNENTVTKTVASETTSTALITSSAAKLSAKSTLYLFKRRIKLAYIKLLKVVKSVFNLDTNENK